MMLRLLKHRSTIWYRRIFTICIFVFVFAFTRYAAAQSTYGNNVYSPAIKTIQFYNISQKDSLPIIHLGEMNKMRLAFDDLKVGSKNYYYTLVHCDALWNPSNISTAEYLENYTDDRILNYSYSNATFQKYTHYELTIPNASIAPKIAGNYLLKVFEDEDQSRVIFTRKLYVIDNKVSVFAQVLPSNDVSLRRTNQKINFTVDYGNLRVQNPATDLRTFVMQNARDETAQLNTQPTYIRGSQLIFSEYNGNDFPGGNEFRHFDTRTLKLNSERVQHIYRDTSNTVVLLTDADRSRDAYTFTYDLNGKFFILNQDGTDPRTDAEYTHVLFSLATPKQPGQGIPYIVGRFNEYKTDNAAKMTFDQPSGKFLADIRMKQGVYDYQYVWVDNAGRQDDYALEGSHFETENNYQVLVYYHPPGARWEELVGFALLNSLRK